MDSDAASSTRVRRRAVREPEYTAHVGESLLSAAFRVAEKRGVLMVAATEIEYTKRLVTPTVRTPFKLPPRDTPPDKVIGPSPPSLL